MTVLRRIERNLAAIQQWKQTYRDGGVGVVTPSDMPVYVRVYQLEDDDDETMPTKGYVLSADVVGMGLEVFIRVDYIGKDRKSDKRVRVIVTDAEGTETLGEWRTDL